jgi:hypothetical protein
MEKQSVKNATKRLNRYRYSVLANGAPTSAMAKFSRAQS